MIEGIMVVAADGPQRYRPRWNGDEQLRTARTCYDHIAGRLGVALTDALTRQQAYRADRGRRHGHARRREIPRRFRRPCSRMCRHGRRTFCRPCIDWSERRPHLAGALGAALAEPLFRARLDRAHPRFARAQNLGEGEHGFARGLRHYAWRRGAFAASPRGLTRSSSTPRGRGARFRRRGRGRRAHRPARRPWPCWRRRDWRPIRRADRPAHRSSSTISSSDLSCRSPEEKPSFLSIDSATTISSPRHRPRPRPAPRRRRTRTPAGPTPASKRRAAAFRS